jgi:tyrosyl-tRNA synthetase
LIHKKEGKTAYGLTNKLILDSTGKKFGKSEGNAIRLDPNKSSPYFVYQYFLNTTDEDVERFLKLFTFYDFDTIKKIVQEHQKNPSDRH